MRIIAFSGLAVALFATFPLATRATTKGLSQIVTPDLQSPGDFSLSFQRKAGELRILSKCKVRSA